MEAIFAGIALLIAAWQLHLQKEEIAKGNALEQKANELEKLKIAADMVKTEIELREKIIADKKAKKSVKWDIEVQPHIDMVNVNLRPSLRSIQKKIIDLYGGQISELDELPRHFYDAKSKKSA